MTRLEQLAALIAHREECKTCGPGALCPAAEAMLERLTGKHAQREPSEE